ncbi:ProQ/FINO family protein [Inhella sp.]|uniref:ProQ/FINO family protein n=1 Tax=Inhella sp. TaxID=1921806 RepID=UPI0035B4B5FA
MSEAAPTPEASIEPARDAQAAAALLKQLFPALFGGAPKPIMLKVQQAIEARAPGRFTKKALSTFFARYTGGTGYLLALTKAEARFDLDGQPAGEVSAEHREAARKLLAERRERVKARDAEMLAARRWRLDLLRDFETSSLSRPNFCALKKVPEAQLDALLAQAREERSNLPPPSAHPGRGRPEGRPNGRTDARPVGRTGIRGEGRPQGRPGAQTDARPDTRHGPKPGPRAERKSD